MIDKSLHQGNGAKPQAAPRPKDAGALYGLRIVDLTQFEAGTSCTETLAWLGAEVIKVEEPTRGEQGRGASTNAGMDSYYFMLLNANKRSVTANLRSEKGKEVLRDLIRTSDVLVENFGPGVIERMGFSWEAIHELNPRMVFAQIKGFGPDGPYGKFLAFDMIAQAAGGSLSVTGEREGRPIRPGVNIGDTGAGIHCATGILAALFERASTGLGQRVEVAMQDVVINFARNTYAAQLLNNGEAARRNGNQSVLAVTSPSEIYPCKGGQRDDYVYIYTSRAAGAQHWPRLLAVIGREDMAEDPRFSDPVKRYENRKAVDEAIAAWTLQHDKATAMQILGEAGVPTGAVYNTKELSDDPYLRERGMFQTVNHPVRGEFVMPVSPIHLSNMKVSCTPSPLLGEDTNDVYGNLLGYDADRIAELRKEKVI